MSTTSAARPPPPSKPSAIPLVPIPTSCFDENHLPSVLHQPDPMTPEAERQARRRTCRFIEEAGGQRCLRLPRVAIATATVFFHRFYAKHAFQEHDRFEVAMACLLLAGKTEESPKKLDLVIRECWKLRRKAQQQQLQNKLVSGGGGDSPGMSPNNIMSSPSSSAAGGGDNLQMKPDEFARLKERVLLLERVILHTIGFELSIDHPFKFLIDCAQGLTKKRLLEYNNPTKKANKLVGKDGQPLGKPQQNNQLVQELAQNAISFANDSLHTSLCLQFSAQQIAMACVYLSGTHAGIGPIGGKTWLDLLDGIGAEELTSISVQILELVQLNRRGVDSGQFRAIRKDLDEMMKKKNDGGGDDGGSSSQPDAKRQKVN